jgi:D-serine deaminase-like pyridoxal phosphate-dependent protein
MGGNMAFRGIGERRRFSMHVLIHSIAALFVLAACAQPAAPGQADNAATEASAVALVNEWAATGNEGRWDDLIAVYGDLPGFTWVEQGEIGYADHEAIAAGVAQARDSGVAVHTTVSDVQATALAPDAAAVRANVSIVFGDPTANGFAFNGMLTGVAVERDRHWVFLQGHLSAPQPRGQPE